MLSPPTQRKSVPGSWMEMGGGILSGHRSPILTSDICDQLAKICSPNSDLKYITIYVEDISQFFRFSTLVKIGPYAVLQLFVSRQCLVVTFPCVCVSVSVCPCVKVSSVCRTILPSITPSSIGFFLTKLAFFGVSSEKIETVLSFFVMEEF